MNKATRHLISIQKQIVRLTVDLVRLQERNVSGDLLSRRVEEIQCLKDKLGIRQ